MAQTLSEGVVVPNANGGEAISTAGVTELVTAGVSINGALASKASRAELKAVSDAGFVPSALVYDSFDRSNGSLRTPTSGGAAWAATAGTGTTGISVVGGSVKAYTGSGNSYGWVPGESDVIVTARVVAYATNPIAGLVARYTGITDHLVLQLRASDTDTTYTLFQRAPALTALVTTTRNPAVGDVFGMRLVGTTVQLVVNGEVLGSGTTSQTGTNVGVYFNGDDPVTAFDDFTVTGV